MATGERLVRMANVKVVSNRNQFPYISPSTNSDLFSAWFLAASVVLQGDGCLELPHFRRKTWWILSFPAQCHHLDPHYFHLHLFLSSIFFFSVSSQFSRIFGFHMSIDLLIESSATSNPGMMDVPRYAFGGSSKMHGTRRSFPPGSGRSMCRGSTRHVRWCWRVKQRSLESLIITANTVPFNRICLKGDLRACGEGCDTSSHSWDHEWARVWPTMRQKVSKAAPWNLPDFPLLLLTADWSTTHQCHELVRCHIFRHIGSLFWSFSKTHANLNPESTPLRQQKKVLWKDSTSSAPARVCSRVPERTSYRCKWISASNRQSKPNKTGTWKARLPCTPWEDINHDQELDTEIGVNIPSRERKLPFLLCSQVSLVRDAKPELKGQIISDLACNACYYSTEWQNSESRLERQTGGLPSSCLELFFHHILCKETMMYT